MRSVHVVLLFALFSGPVLLPVIYFYFIMPMYANNIFVFFFFNFLVYLFLTLMGLHHCAWTFFSGEWGLL